MSIVSPRLFGATSGRTVPGPGTWLRAPTSASHRPRRLDQSRFTDNRGSACASANRFRCSSRLAPAASTRRYHLQDNPWASQVDPLRLVFPSPRLSRDHLQAVHAETSFFQRGSEFPRPQSGWGPLAGQKQPQNRFVDLRLQCSLLALFDGEPVGAAEQVIAPSPTHGDTHTMRSSQTETSRSANRVRNVAPSMSPHREKRQLL